MEYATLNNGVKMPMAGIGTFMLSPDEAEASVLSALQCGYRLIDTANAYVNEKAVGRAMKKSGLPREEIFLETKLWPAFYEQPDAVEKTLQRLDTGYIDLLADPPARGQLRRRLPADGESLQGGQGEGHRPVQLQRKADCGDLRHLRSKARRSSDRSASLFSGKGS